MSERERLAAEATRASKSLEEAFGARDRGEESDLVAAAEADERPLDEQDEAQRWERCGRLLRAKDPATYRLLSATATAIAALAAVSDEN